MPDQKTAIASLRASLGLGKRKPRRSPSSFRGEIKSAQVEALERVLVDIRKKARENSSWANAYYSAATSVELEIATIKSSLKVASQLGIAKVEVSKERVFELANQHATSDPIDPGKVYSIFTDDGLVAFARALLSTQAQPVTQEVLDHCWKMYKRGQVSADHTAQEVFEDVLRSFAKWLLSASPAQAREQEIRKEVLEKAITACKALFRKDPDVMEMREEIERRDRFNGAISRCIDTIRALATDQEGRG